ncbi:MAG: metallophosphatase family protein [Proteobacteria bacterium]|nr:metallophosphatase family protein [Pseudomonadota bacterium]
MKIAILSDIHSNFFALKAVYEDLKEQGVAQIYSLGDLVGYFPFIEETIEFVVEKNIITILGNYDKAVIHPSEKEGLLYLMKNLPDDKKKLYLWTRENVSKEVVDFLSGLPLKINLTFQNFKMLLVHGSPSGISNYIYPDTSVFYLESLLRDNMVDIIACGHTHKSMVLTTQEGYVVNPGSVGVPDDNSPNASYMIIEIDKMPKFYIRNVGYDVDFVKKIQQEKIYKSFESV